MTTTWFLSLLGYGETLTLAVVLSIFFWRRLAPSWPSLAIALSVELATDFALIWLLGRPGYYRAYFYVYWLSIGFQAAMRMWMMADILRSFPGTGFISARVYLFAGSTCTFMAIWSAVYTYKISVVNDSGFMETVILLDRCVNVAWVVFIAILLVGVKLFGFAWSPVGARIANGVFARICAGAITGELVASKYVLARAFGNVFDSCCSIAIFCFWAYHAERASREIEAPDTQEAVAHSLQLLSTRQHN